MTHVIEKTTRRYNQRTRTRHAEHLLFGLFTLFCLLVILRNSDAAIAYVTRGLLLCARTVIPSLFPFMVLSELIVAGGFGTSAIGCISTPFKRLLHLSEAGCCAFLLGLLCGFPIGARCAVSAYERGEITKAECERVLGISGAPSSAFLISAVGASLWESRTFGIALYAAVVLSAILTACIQAHAQKSTPCAVPDEYAALREPPLHGATLLTHSIRSATEGILSVTAYVVFFSVLTGTLELVLAPLSLSPILHAAIGGFLELSGGVSLAAGLETPIAAALLTAATVAWSGLSVHCQILAVTSKSALSMRPYLRAKIVQTLLTVVLIAILIYICPAIHTAGSAAGM